MLNFLNKLFSSPPPVDFAGLVKDGALIVDVRTSGEFNSGHIKGSINIPLDTIQSKAAELKKKGKTIITCCRSGSRSGMAKSMLEGAGITCYNGGAWNDLQNKI